jgi:hypothetical protein
MKLPTPNNDNSPRPATVFLFMAQYRQCALEDGERREKWLAKAKSGISVQARFSVILNLPIIQRAHRRTKRNIERVWFAIGDDCCSAAWRLLSR